VLHHLKTVGTGIRHDHSERKYHLKGISHPIHLTVELDNTHTIFIHRLVSKISLGCEAWKAPWSSNSSCHPSIFCLVFLLSSQHRSAM